MPLAHRSDPGDEWVMKEVLARNVYLKSFLLPFLDPPGIVVDVGAHIGTFTIRACRDLRPRVILAVEPESSNFQLLVENLRAEGLAEVTRTFRVALWDRSGDLPLLIQAGNSGGASLLPMKATMERARVKGQEVVPVSTLDRLLEESGVDEEPIRLLKVDAEGAELPILRGAPKALSRTSVIVGEVHEGVADLDEFRRLLDEFVLVTGEPTSPLAIRTFWAVHRRFHDSKPREVSAFLRDAPVEDLRDVCWRLREEIAGKDAYRERLESQLRHLEAALASVIRSRSWQLTEPLRRAYGALRWIRSGRRAPSTGADHWRFPDL